MSAYNRLGGTFCSEHPWLIQRVLREEWGFRGLVVTDWGAVNDRVAGLNAGLDLEMPSSGGGTDRCIVSAVRSGRVAASALDEAAARVTAMALVGAEQQALVAEGQTTTAADDLAKHHALARCAGRARDTSTWPGLMRSAAVSHTRAACRRRSAAVWLVGQDHGACLRQPFCACITDAASRGPCVVPRDPCATAWPCPPCPPGVLQLSALCCSRTMAACSHSRPRDAWRSSAPLLRHRASRGAARPR